MCLVLDFLIVVIGIFFNIWDRMLFCICFVILIEFYMFFECFGFVYRFWRIFSGNLNEIFMKLFLYLCFMECKNLCYLVD